MSDQERRSLPKYDLPPVVETVVSIEFTPLERWDVRYFGVYWKEVEGDFPEFEVKPPLGSKIETYSKPVPTSPEVQFLTKPEFRSWFISADHQRLIQVQHDRFIYNWRKGDSDVPYPHYDASIRPTFERELKRFQAFIAREKLGKIEVVQCEVTYVNHLEIGNGWSTAADIHNVFRCWSADVRSTFLPAPEGVAMDVRYRLPNDQGRLHVSIRPAIRNRDGAEILQMTLTARGQPSGEDLGSALAWLDLGREWVVRGFTDFTAETMHKIWQRKA